MTRRTHVGLAALVATSFSLVAPARAADPPLPCGEERAAWTKEATVDSATALASCELRAEHYREAARVLAPFVVADADGVPVRMRAREVFEGARVRLLTVKVEVDVLGADLFIDDELVGRSPLATPLFVAPGTHTLTAKAEGHAPVSQVIVGAAGESTSLMVYVIPRRRDVVGYDTPSNQPLQAARGKSVPLIIVGSAAAGVALAIGVTFTVLAVGKGSTVSDSQKAILAGGGSTSTCAAPTSAFVTNCSTLHDALSKRDSFENAAIESFLIGGALLGATLAYALWPTNRRPNRWEPSIAGVRVRPQPLLGRDVGGLVLTGTF